MCGFVGVVAWDDRFRVDCETLAKMSARIAHRGPDGEGLWINHEQEITPRHPQAALAHRRLAILDPDPRANQPFTDHAGRWIVFNGEIYNFRELRKELTSLRPEYQWRTNCDTEVLLVAYDAWGEKCVERLNGMFAFAVWDEPAKTLFLARDRMGQKPMFFAAVDRAGKPWVGVPAVAADGQSLDEEDPARRGAVGRHLQGEAPAAIAFASEIPALLPLRWLDASTYLSAVSHYLRWGYCGCGTVETVYSGVQRLPHSCWLTIRTQGFEASKYFDAEASDIHQRRTSNDVRQLVREAVSRQLVSDVPLGCFLSGGVDSSVIAASMRDAEADVHTFSVGFDDPRYDERQYAEAVAKHLGTRHESFLVQPDAVHDLPKLASVFGEPFGDSSALPTHYLSRETRAHVKVALSGDGGDELFGGYDRYRAMRLTQRLSPLFLAAAIGAGGSARRFNSPGSKTWSTRVGRLLATYDRRPDVRYANMMRLFDEATLREMLPRGSFEFAPDIDSISCRFVIERQLRSRKTATQIALAVDRNTYLPGDLLTKVDRASMLHALEVRSPFMDPDVVTFAAGLTTDQLLKGGPKRMLREAFAGDLPAWVFKRKKMGFAVPIGNWLRTSLRPMLHDLLFAFDSFAAGHFNKPVLERLIAEHQEMRVDHSQRLYALLMLELWWRNR